MDVNYTNRNVGYDKCTRYADRPIVGIVLHDTEGSTPLTVYESAGSWHWLVGRDGTVYCDVSEANAAWHVEATDRWRPDWIVRCPDGRVSDANYCTIGIEIVSDAACRAAGIPFTDAQYAAVRELLADIKGRHGDLPVVGHGQLQANRSDPVRFDWSCLTAPAAAGAGTEDPLAALQAELATVRGAQLLADLIKAEFERYIREPAHAQAVDADATGQGVAPADLMIRWANEHYLGVS